jgi:hypothetical protein
MSKCHYCEAVLPDGKAVLEHMKDKHPKDYERLMRVVKDYKQMEEDYLK